MKIIYDDLSIEEFFQLGGRVHVGSFGFDVDTRGEFEKTIKNKGWKDEYINDRALGGDAWIGDMHFTYSDYTFNYRGTLPVTPPNDPYGVPNTCFSLIDPQDSRWKEYQKMRIEQGFDPSECWSLDATILKFILPRLEYYKEHTCGNPAYLTFEQWQDILGKMCDAIKIALYDEDAIDGPDIIKRIYGEREPEKCKELLGKNERYRRGVRLFYKYFHSLWD